MEPKYREHFFSKFKIIAEEHFDLKARKTHMQDYINAHKQKMPGFFQRILIDPDIDRDKSFDNKLECLKPYNQKFN